MIGTLRKHSGIVWGIIIAAMIVGLVFWTAGPSSRVSGYAGRPGGALGTVYDHKITSDDYRNAYNEFMISYWFRSNGEWPDKNPNFTETELEREVYVRIMLFQRAKDLGIRVSNDAVVTAANEMLHSLGRDGRTLPLEVLVKQVLEPKGLTAEDFQEYVRLTLVLQQLQQAIGMTGELVSPQEASMAYQRDHREISAQMVSFSGSNYLSGVTVAPADVIRFYTNYLAEYRLPDRVQVSYVAFDLTNYLAAAEQKLAQTNLAQQVDSIYLQYGTNATPGAKTPEEAKARIRTLLIRQQAAQFMRLAANEFATTVFNKEPANPENLSIIARQQGLTVHVTAPFSMAAGPEEFAAPAAFSKAAFGLTPDVPFAGPVLGSDAAYVLAFGRQFPSEIPSLDQIRDQVTRDYRWHEAVMKARQAGTNFVLRTVAAMAAGTSFDSLCTSAGLRAETLPPFSLSTRELPQLGERIELNQLKAAAFQTEPGKASGFEETEDGGFVVYVRSYLPVEQAQINADLPQYIAALRRARASEAFNEWVNLEANRQLRNTPLSPTFGGGLPTPGTVK